MPSTLNASAQYIELIDKFASNPDNKATIATLLNLDKDLQEAHNIKEKLWSEQGLALTNSYISRTLSSTGVEAVSKTEQRKLISTISNSIAPILLLSIAGVAASTMPAYFPELSSLASLATSTLDTAITSSYSLFIESAPTLIAIASASALAYDSNIRKNMNKLMENSQHIVAAIKEWMDKNIPKFKDSTKKNLKSIFDFIKEKVPAIKSTLSFGKAAIEKAKEITSSAWKINKAYKDPTQQTILTDQRETYQTEINNILSKLSINHNKEKIALILKEILETRLLLNLGVMSDDEDASLRKLSTKHKNNLMILGVDANLMSGDLLSANDMQLIDIGTLEELRRKGALGMTNMEITKENINNTVDYADIEKVFNDNNEASIAALNELHSTIDYFLNYPPMWISPFTNDFQNLKMSFKKAMDPDFNPSDNPDSSKFLITKESISALMDHSNTIKIKYKSAIPTDTLETLSNIILNPEDIKYTTNTIQKINNLGEVVNIDPDSLASSFKHHFEKIGFNSSAEYEDQRHMLFEFHMDNFHGHDDFKSKISKITSDQLFWFLSNNIPNPDSQDPIDNQTFITIQKELLAITDTTNQQYITNNISQSTNIDDILIAPKIIKLFSELENSIEALTTNTSLSHQAIQSLLIEVRKNQNYLNATEKGHFKHATQVLKDMGKYNPHTYQYLLDTNFDDYYVRNQNTDSIHKNFTSSSNDDPRIATNTFSLSQEDKISTIQHNYIDNEITKESYEYTKSVLSNLVLKDSGNINDDQRLKINEIFNAPHSEDLKQSFTDIIENLQWYIANTKSDISTINLNKVAGMLTASDLSNNLDEAVNNPIVKEVKYHIIEATKHFVNKTYKDIITKFKEKFKNVMTPPAEGTKVLESTMNKEIKKQEEDTNLDPASIHPPS
jgi:hypothetical protein